MRARIVFSLTLCLAPVASLSSVAGCSGQAAPISSSLPVPDHPPREVLVTPDAALPSTVGAACDAQHACGAPLTCDHSAPGGYCETTCGRPGTACGDGVCVEQPDRDVCRARCTSNADCREDEGYACDPAWHACALANSLTIVPTSCPPPVGLGREVAFLPPSDLGAGRAPATIVADDGSLVIAYERGSQIVASRIDPQGRPAQVKAASSSSIKDPTLGSDNPALAAPSPTNPSTDPSTAPALADGRWPVLARDGARIYAAWIRTAPSRESIGTSAQGDRNGRVELAVSTDRGATWRPAIAVDDNECGLDAGTVVQPASPAAIRRCDAPQLAVGADPQKPGATILYLGYAAGDGIRIRTSRDGGATFSPARTALPGLRGDLATDAKGNLYAIALAGARLGVYGTGDRRLDLAMSYDGGRTFTRPQTLSRNGESLPLYGTTPAILVDPNRRWLYVAYARGGRDAKWDLALLSLRQNVDNAKWQRTRLGDDCATMLGPNLALDPITGLVHVAWYDTRGLRFAHATCSEGLAGCRQVGRINDAPLAGLSFARHGPTSVGEAQGLAVDWTRRTLHAVWTQAVDDAGSPAARIFHTRAKLPLR